MSIESINYIAWTPKRRFPGFMHMLSCIWYSLQLCERYNKLFSSNLQVFFEYAAWNNILKTHLNINSINFNHAPVKLTKNNYPLNRHVHRFKYEHLSDTHLQYLYKLTQPIDGCQLVVTSAYIAQIKPDTFFNLFKPTELLKNLIKEKVQLLDNNYVAIHLRGSDKLAVCYSEFEHFEKRGIDLIEKARKEHSDKKILLCSDNQEFLVKYVDEKTIFSNSLPFLLAKDKKILPRDASVHGLMLTNSFNISGEDVNINTLLDFYLMVLSTVLYYDNNSGYSCYAYSFNNHLKNNIELNDI